MEHPLAIGALGIGAMFLLILLQVPIGFAMIIVGVAGFALVSGLGPALTILSGESWGLLSSVDLATVPLFLLMGTFATAAGFSRDIYAAAAALIGHRPGGLAYATVGGSAMFGAVCGSSTATAATFAKAALPEMLRSGYAPSFSTGAIAAGGTLKALIPPSIVMVLYCIVARTYIFDLFIAAIVPALITIALNLLAIWVVVRRDPSLAPLSPRVPWPERLLAVRRAAPVLALLFCVFAGLYSGVFTVNEAASVAAALSLLLAVAMRRLDWTSAWRGLREAASATAMIYVIIIGASIFTYFLNIVRVPEAMTAAIGGLNLPPVLIVFTILAAYLVLGAVFDEISAMLITLPFVLPVITGLGYDPIWWGIINVIVIELGMIIPPIGIIVFLLHGLAPQIPLRVIYRGVMPFVAANLAMLVLLTLVPDLALWLPRALR